MAGKWELCDYCQQIRYTGSKMNHKCPVMVRELKEEWAKEEAAEIMYEFNKDLDKFWKDPQTQFLRHLAERGDI